MNFRQNDEITRQMDNEIYLKDMPDGNTDSGDLHVSDSGTPVMSGHFNLQIFPGGLSMHTNDAMERQTGENRLELPEGLSFNIIFAGHVDYSFADQRFLLTPDDDQPVCSIIINNSHEVMTRYLSPGTRVRKVNIFVERRWLEARSPSDKSQVASIFRSKQVVHWNATNEMIEKASRLMHASNSEELTNKLQLEQLTLDLLSSCLTQLQSRLNDVAAKADRTIETSLKAEIDQRLDSCRNLAELSASLNMSERTLQRKFKSSYQQTVSSYVKRRRLEIAKKALVVDHLSIGEASFRAGYNHTSNFVHAFKKAFGLTPADFVSRHRGMHGPASKSAEDVCHDPDDPFGSVGR